MRNSILSIVHPQKRSSQPSGKFGLQHRFEAFFPEKCNKTLPSQTCSPAQRLHSACKTADEWFRLSNRFFVRERTQLTLVRFKKTPVIMK
jgi:hypothetical protein